MLKSIATAAIVASVLLGGTAEAATANNKHWVVGFDGDFLGVKSSHNTIGMMFARDVKGEYNYFIQVSEPTCKGWSDEFADWGHMPVNGQKVAFSYQCTAENDALVFPTNAAGTNYMTAQFWSMNSVRIDEVTFTAKGFQKAVKRMHTNNKVL